MVVQHLQRSTSRNSVGRLPELKPSDMLPLAVVSALALQPSVVPPLRNARQPYGVRCVERASALPLARAPPPAMATPSELIDLGVRVDTFAPQFLWLLIVAFPRTKLTERVMGPLGPLLGLSLVHLAIVLLAATKPGGTEPILIFADVFDPAKSQLDGMVRLFEVRDFVAEEWPHVLLWDLFVGRAIWLDNLERGAPFAWAALLLTNGIGPPGLLLYATLCLGSGRGLPTMGYVAEE